MYVTFSNLTDQKSTKLGIKFLGFLCECGKVDNLIDDADIPLKKEIINFFLTNLILQKRVNHDFDAYVGPMTYTLTERSNCKIVSIPVQSGLVFVILEKQADHSRIINDIFSALKYKPLSCKITN